jgi:hypothetical protein
VGLLHAYVCDILKSVNGTPGRRIPVDISIHADSLVWDPWSEGALVGARETREDDLDEFAAIARPSPEHAWRQSVLSKAKKWGPLSWCSTCLRLHHVDWRMTAPRRVAPMREPLSDWQATADHVNATRRLIARLRGARGLEEDWATVWPDRPGGLARGPDQDLVAEYDLTRATAPWGELWWERSMLAGHLTSWIGSCHGQVVRWTDAIPAVVPSAGSLLGELGGLLVRELLDTKSRIRSCEGAVRGRPCRITWTVVHDKPRKAPMLCDGCYALYRQRETQSKPQGGSR